MKITYSLENINSFGGINFADHIVKNDFNINMGMNKLLVKLAVQTGQLSPKNDNYIFDYDNQFIPTDKYDSKRSYGAV